MADEFDPYHVWLGIPPDQQPPTHYRLLGIELYESNADVIDAAASRQTAYLHQLSSGPNRKASQKILNEIAAARRCLLDADARAKYDDELKSQQATDVAASDPQPPPVPAPPTPASTPSAVQQPAASVDDAPAGKPSSGPVVKCHKCSTKFRSPTSEAGRMLACPKCKTLVQVPAAEPQFPVPTEPPAAQNDFPDFSGIVTEEGSPESDLPQIDIDVGTPQVDVGAPQIQVGEDSSAARPGRRKSKSRSKSTRRTGPAKSTGKAAAAESSSDDAAEEARASKLPMLAGGIAALVIGAGLFLFPSGDQPATEEEVVDQGIPFADPSTTPGGNLAGAGGGKAAGSVLNAAAGGGVALKAEDIPGTVVDDVIATKKPDGKWTTASDKTFVGEGYAVSNEKGATIRFPFAAKSAGDYELRLRYVPNEKFGKAIKVSVKAGRGKPATRTVNMSNASGQPRYHSLGTFTLKKGDTGSVTVTVSGSGASADALQVISLNAINTGMTGYWTFDQPAARMKAATSAHQATSAVFEARQGVRQKAIRISGDASGPGVRIPPAVFEGNEGSLCLWFRHEETAKKRVVVIASEGAGSVITFIVGEPPANNTIARVTDSWEAPQIKTTGHAPSNQWHHVVMTWELQKEAKIYLNGRLVGTQQNTKYRKPKAIKLGRGTRDASVAPISFDELRIYRRVLSPQQVETLYRLDAPETPTADKPKSPAAGGGQKP